MLSIVVVNWNSGDGLARLFESLELSARALQFEVIVADNDSHDDSLARIQTDLSFDRKILRMSENLGFGKACNAAAQHAKGELLLFLNPDTVLGPGTLREVIQFFSERKDIDVLGVQLRDEQGIQRTCARRGTPLNILMSTSGLAKIFPGLFTGVTMHEWGHDESREVDHVIGAFYLLRRSDFEEAGGFDERYFLYYEDLDLSYRLRAQGKGVFYWTGVSIYHEGGGTSKAIKDRRLFYSLRSRSQFVKKHYSRFTYLIYWLSQYLIEFPLRQVRALAALDFDAARNTLRAYRWLFKDEDGGIASIL